jgi:hypothetical protein
MQRLKSSETRVLVGFSIFVFPFYKMLFMNKLKSTRVFPFRGFFFVRFFRTRVESGFLSGFFWFVSVIFIIFTCRCLLCRWYIKKHRVPAKPVPTPT